MRRSKLAVLPAPVEERECHALALAFSTWRQMCGDARRDSTYPLDRDDLRGAALLGAAKALQRFDETRGAHFATFALSLIRGEILEEMRKQDWLSRRRRKQARAEVEQTGEWPEWALWPASLDEPAGFDEEGQPLSIRDLLPGREREPEMETLRVLENERWSRLIDWLPETERHVFRRYYCDQMTLREVGVELGLTEQRVHQLAWQARKRLAEWARAEGLAPF